MITAIVMKRILLATMAILLVGFTPLLAVDSPHDTTASIHCGVCHIPHATLGEILVNATDSLVSTLCLSCHTPGGWAGMTMTMSSSQKADPGTSGVSHAWDVKAINAARGAELPQTAALFDHLTADSSVTCATCHDPHANTVSPFLRLDNSADALCLDCHRSRDNSSVRTYTGSVLSHPVGVVLPSDSMHHNPPLDVNGSPQPSDGNTTNDLALLSGNIVSCTTCHGIHYTDSNSGTTDGP